MKESELHNESFQGNYTLTDYEFKKEKLPVVLPVGNYEVKIYYLFEKKLLGGTMSRATVKPTL